MTRTVLLVRHPEIEAAWKTKCYGASDVPLSPAGRAGIPPLAERLAATHKPDQVLHTGVTRTRELAVAIARSSNCQLVEATGFLEMNFGDWEGRDWSEVFADVGHDMARLIHEPDSYAPSGGETVHAMRARVVSALVALPDDRRTIVVTHGGPVSAIKATLDNLPAPQWPGLVPPYGHPTEITSAQITRLRRDLPGQA